MADQKWPVHGEITGPIVMIGFGSIGRGTLPLIERHFKFDKSRMIVIDPSDENRKLLDERGIAYLRESVTRKNYKKLLTPLLTKGGGQAFCVNLSVDTGSVDLMHLCRKLGALYVDTVVEPWLGFYFDAKADNASRTNYALRETLREEKRKHPGGPTAVSTCGANPGMVSWLVKQALVNLAGDLGLKFKEPGVDDREGWARLMKKAGVKGIHIAERDTQRAKKPKPLDVFWNTWSVEGFGFLVRCVSRSAMWMPLTPASFMSFAQPSRSSCAGSSNFSPRSRARLTSAFFTNQETMPGLAPQQDTAVVPPGFFRFSSRMVSRRA